MTISRRGFTLIELLVVITIIGILTGIMMPALHSAREAGRRTSCANNLMRLGLATGAYESAHGFFPAGVTDSKGPILNKADGLHHSWTERLLPYLDERAVFAKIDFDASVYDPKNATVRGLQLVPFLCPSDDVVDEGPHSSYAACHNEAEAPIDADNHGVFFLNSRLRPDDITDGLGYTLFIAEKKTDAAGNDLGWTSGTRATLRNTGTPLNGTGPRATVSNPATGGPTFVGGFGSDHAGGIVATVFGDGSVRYVYDVIDPKVLKLLGHRADGKLINLKDLE
jgi:prepilin-type N-terminal cleavage/methylation domain-containing protein